MDFAQQQTLAQVNMASLLLRCWFACRKREAGKSGMDFAQQQPLAQVYMDSLLLRCLFACRKREACKSGMDFAMPAISDSRFHGLIAAVVCLLAGSVRQASQAWTLPCLQSATQEERVSSTSGSRLCADAVGSSKSSITSHVLNLW
jgi:hypothetical protein